MFLNLLDEIQRVLTPLALAAFTAFIAYAWSVLYSWLGIAASDSNEMEIRRAAATEAGKLVASGLTDAMSIESAVSKILADLPAPIKAEGYTRNDVADMIVGDIPVIGTVLSALVKKQ